MKYRESLAFNNYISTHLGHMLTTGIENKRNNISVLKKNLRKEK